MHSAGFTLRRNQLRGERLGLSILRKFIKKGDDCSYQIAGMSEVIVLAIMLLFFFVLPVFFYVRGAILYGILFQLPLLLILLSFVFRLDGSRRSHKEEVLRTMLLSRMCGSCGYPLDGLSVEEDGCRVCPECGAAWRADLRRKDEYRRWWFNWLLLSKLVHDDRGWQGYIHFGQLPFDVGRSYARSNVARCASGWCGIASFVFMVLMLVMLAMSIGAWFFEDSSKIGLVGIAGLATLFVALLVTWEIGKLLHSEEIRLALLGHGYCPCCNGRLPESAQDDGCFVCEVCGAAWRQESEGKI